MLTNLALLFSVGLFLVAEATINICTSLDVSNAETLNANELVSELKSVAISGLSYVEDNPDFSTSHVDLNISHPAISVQGALDNVRIFNLQDMDVCLTLNETQSNLVVDVELTFNNLRIESDYNITGDIGDLFDIYGKGNFWMVLKNLSVSGAVTFGSDLCFLIDVDVHLVNVTNDFSNFMDDSELTDLFNALIRSILPESIDIIWSEIKDIFDKPLEDAINKILHHSSLPRIAKTLLLHAATFETLNYCYP